MALLRPSELARAWELHPKTVYLWIREGRLPAIKTPGAQYRVRTDDARAYCRANDLPMPRGLETPGGSVAMLGKNSASQRALAKACKARGTTVNAWASTLEGLLAIAGDAPDVVAIDAGADEVKLVDALRALKRTPATANVPVVVYDVASASALRTSAKTGAEHVVPKGQHEELTRIVTDLLDTRRS